MLGYFNYTTWLTYLGACFGVIGIWCAAQGHVTTAIVLLSLSGLTDSFDGKVASTKKDRTDEMKKFGIQLDSLSDLICFGVLPAVLLYAFAKGAFPDLSPLVFLSIGCVYVLAALIRLAYFNVAEEKRQKEEQGVRKYYNGIPVTLVSIFIPIFYGLSEILRFLLHSIVAPEHWRIGFFIFYCLLILFFAFGFLYSRFKVKKLRGKRMAFVIALGAVGLVGVILAYIFNT